MINFSTGPTDIHPLVQESIALPAISHRSREFLDIYNGCRQMLCNLLHVRKSFILTGSGTLANEVMLAQIKSRLDGGLIISNGEFGERLVNQARRFGISFKHLRYDWGQVIDGADVKNRLSGTQTAWVLMCHCESSTGVINDKDAILPVCQDAGADLYLDCMTTFALGPLDLTGIAMATASSGKAVGSMAGLALVFANAKPIPNPSLPSYLDLVNYDVDGVPFTLSSKALQGLKTALRVNTGQERWVELNDWSHTLFQHFSERSLVPFAEQQTRIFTFTQHQRPSTDIASDLLAKGLELSYQSGYLQQRNWIQLALFGQYSQNEVKESLELILDPALGLQPHVAVE